MSESDPKRENVVRQAVANERLEGLRVSKETLEIAANYIEGNASATEVAKKIRERYGINVK